MDRNTVEYVASLAHIGLSENELEGLTEQLSSIVAHVGRLQEIDTDGIEPTAHAIPLSNVMREDEVTVSWPVDAVLANAPARHNTFFSVQAVLE